MRTVLKWLTLLFVTAIVLLAGTYAYSIMTFDTDTYPENHGKVDAQLFMGEGRNQPLLVGFGGSEGGNAWASEHWKSQRDEFVSQGYAFLAVGYFGAPGTPENLDRIALEGVHQAIMEAAAQPGINAECIAVVGGSKGAELSLLLASQFPDVKAVVAIVPGSAVFPGLTHAMNTPSFSINGEWLPFVPIPWSAAPALIKGDLRAAFTQALQDRDAVENAAIPVENINGPIMFLSATRDEFWPSTEMSEYMVERLEKAQFPHYSEHLAIDGGHGEPLKHFDAIETFLDNHFLNGNTATCAE